MFAQHRFSFVPISGLVSKLEISRHPVRSTWHFDEANYVGARHFIALPPR